MVKKNQQTKLLIAIFPQPTADLVLLGKSIVTASPLERPLFKSDRIRGSDVISN